MVHTYFLLLHVGLVRNLLGIRIGFRLFGLDGRCCRFGGLTVGQVIGGRVPPSIRVLNSSPLIFSRSISTAETLCSSAMCSVRIRRAVS